MESSGVFWKPVYNLLEGLDLTLLVVNARHIKAVPGARLTSRVRSGLLTCCATGRCGAATFQGDRSENCGSWCAIGEAWSASGPRWSTAYGRPGRRQHQLSSGATNVVGVSGHAMLEALASGIDDPEALAELAKDRLQQKRPALDFAVVRLSSSQEPYSYQLPS
jgi:hypothetical protein